MKKILEKIFLIVYITISICILITTFMTDLKTSIIFSSVVLLLIFLIIFIKKNYKINFSNFLNKKWLIILIAISILIRIIIVLSKYVDPTSDYATFYYNAIALATNSPIVNKYIAVFPYLYNYMYLLSMFFKLFGTMYENVVIFNTIIDLIGAVFCYLFMKNIANHNTAKISLLIWLFNPFSIIFNSFCSPVIIVNSCIAIVFYFFDVLLKNKNSIKNFLVLSIIMGILLGISNSFRPIFIIFIITIFILYIYILIINKKGYLKYILSFILICSAYLTINNIYFNEVSKVTKYNVEKSMAGWSLYLGSSLKTNGQWYKEAAEELGNEWYKDSFDPTDINNMFQKKAINNYINNGINNLILFKNKAKVLSGYVAAYTYYAYLDNYKFNFNTQEQFSLKLYLFISYYLLLILNIYNSIVNKKIDLNQLPFVIFFIGLYSSSLLVEVSPRYFFPMFVPLILFSSFSISKILFRDKKIDI